MNKVFDALKETLKVAVATVFEHESADYQSVIVSNLASEAYFFGIEKYIDEFGVDNKERALGILNSDLNQSDKITQLSDFFNSGFNLSRFEYCMDSALAEIIKALPSLVKDKKVDVKKINEGILN